ncbi:MAG: hypothetical protein M3Q71_18385 [Chloroflexota bacterium]|nr:hypothetical protein [Chloroflexota bacterium]
MHKEDGRIIAIEVKRPDGKRKATDKQKEFLQEIKSRGGYAGVATSLDDVDRILNESPPLPTVTRRKIDVEEFENLARRVREGMSQEDID